MSINREMKEYFLQRKTKERTQSGAGKEQFQGHKMVNVAIYNSGERFIQASVRYKEATHVGLTHERGIQAGLNRLISDNVIYSIIDCKPEAKFTILILKLVTTDV